MISFILLFCFVLFLSSFSHSAVSNSFKPHKPGSRLHGISHARILELLLFPPPEYLPNSGIKPSPALLESHSFYWATGSFLGILLDIWKIQSLLNYKEQLEKYIEEVFFKASTKIKIYNSLERSEMLKLFKFQLILWILYK